MADTKPSTVTAMSGVAGASSFSMRTVTLHWNSICVPALQES